MVVILKNSLEILPHSCQKKSPSFFQDICKKTRSLISEPLLSGSRNAWGRQYIPMDTPENVITEEPNLFHIGHDAHPSRIRVVHNVGISTSDEALVSQTPVLDGLVMQYAKKITKIIFLLFYKEYHLSTY